MAAGSCVVVGLVSLVSPLLVSPPAPAVDDPKA